MIKKIRRMDAENIQIYLTALRQQNYSVAQGLYERSNAVREHSVLTFDMPLVIEPNGINTDTTPLYDDWDLEDYRKEFQSRFLPYGLAVLVNRAEKTRKS